MLLALLLAFAPPASPSSTELQYPYWELPAGGKNTVIITPNTDQLWKLDVGHGLRVIINPNGSNVLGSEPSDDEP